MAELQDVFASYWDDYQAGHRVSHQQEKAACAITVCRTAELGGHIEVCDTCGHERISYNSCRNRHCPKCQATKREAWVQARLDDLWIGNP